MSNRLDRLNNFTASSAQKDPSKTSCSSQIIGLSVPIRGDEKTKCVMVRLPESVVSALNDKLNPQGEKVAPWIRKLIMELVARKG